MWTSCTGICPTRLQCVSPVLSELFVLLTWQKLSKVKAEFVQHILSLALPLPSVLWHCWLGGRKGIRPVENWVVGCWRGCLGWGADLHIAQQMPLPLTISCSSKSRLVLTFLVYLSGTCSRGWSRTYSRRALKQLCMLSLACKIIVCIQSNQSLQFYVKGQMDSPLLWTLILPYFVILLFLSCVVLCWILFSKFCWTQQLWGQKL